MANVVITGSTRGIGRGLAVEFLKRGHNVVVSSRRQADVDKAAEWQKIQPILNILCDYVETSTPWLVEQMLANRQSGRRIAWMSTGKLLGRFLRARLPGPKRDLFTRFGL